jgi:hypothetical protein
LLLLAQTDARLPCRFDAGDANRFTITMSSAVSSLAWALLDAQAGFNASQLSPYATSTIE